MRFKCVWSNIVTSVTVVVLVLFGLVLYQFGSSLHYGLIMLIFATILVCFAYTPIYIEVTLDSLIIKRAFGSLIIPRKDIESIGLYDGRFSIRKFGSGGFLGYLGWFSNSEIGNYFSYSTDESNQIIVVTRNRKYVISCENKEELLRKFI